MDKLPQKRRTEYFRNHGIDRETGIAREGVADAPHPSCGGSKGYSYSERIYWLDKWRNDPSSVPKRMFSSLRRWDVRDMLHEMTGGKQSQAMSGHHLFLLVFFKKVYPQAKLSQCAVFIAVHSSDNRVFSDQEICKALGRLGMTRKRASTTAYQAFTPKNLRLHDMFWTHPFPAGIADVLRKDLIDVDEMAIELKDSNQNYGHAVKDCRVRKNGHYGRGEFKITLQMGIEAGDPDPDIAGQLGSIDLPRI